MPLPYDNLPWSHPLNLNHPKFKNAHPKVKASIMRTGNRRHPDRNRGPDPFHPPTLDFTAGWRKSEWLRRKRNGPPPEGAEIPHWADKQAGYQILEQRKKHQKNPSAAYGSMNQKVKKWKTGYEKRGKGDWLLIPFRNGRSKLREEVKVSGKRKKGTVIPNDPKLYRDMTEREELFDKHNVAKAAKRLKDIEEEYTRRYTERKLRPSGFEIFQIAIG